MPGTNEQERPLMSDRQNVETYIRELSAVDLPNVSIVVDDQINAIIEKCLNNLRQFAATL